MGVGRQWLDNKRNPAGRCLQYRKPAPGCGGQSFRSIDLEIHLQDFLLTASIVFIVANSVLDTVPNILDHRAIFWLPMLHQYLPLSNFISSRQDLEAITSRFTKLFLTLSPFPYILILFVLSTRRCSVKNAMSANNPNCTSSALADSLLLPFGSSCSFPILLAR